MSAPAIRAVRLAFAHGDAVPLFEDVSFHVGPGWWGLVGDNGSGKTTLLRLIAGQLRPESGVISVEPDPAHIELCEQSVEHVPERAAELAGGDGGDAVRLRAGLELEPTQLERWATLSPGERKRWQIGAALLAAPDLLLCDEPTNHLDAAGRGLLIAALRRHRGLGLVVSHDRALLDELTRGTMRVRARDAAVDVAPAAYSRARQAWAGEEAAAAAAREAAEARLADARRRADAARRDLTGATRSRSTRARMKNRHDSDARTAMAGNLAEWAQARAGRRVGAHATEVARAEAEVSGLPPPQRAFGRSLLVDWAPSPRRVLLSLEMDELRAGPAVLARAVRAHIARGDRVHLRGANGSGKSRLIAALLASSTLPPARVLHLPQELTQAAGAGALTALRARPPAERGRHPRTPGRAGSRAGPGARVSPAVAGGGQEAGHRRRAGPPGLAPGPRRADQPSGPALDRTAGGGARGNSVRAAPGLARRRVRAPARPPRLAPGRRRAHRGAAVISARTLAAEQNPHHAWAAIRARRGVPPSGGRGAPASEHPRVVRACGRRLDRLEG